jgi:hypothetical protein
MTRINPGSGRGPYVQQGCTQGTVLCCTVVLAEWSYKQAERRGSLQVPEVRLRRSANIVDVGGNVQVCSYPSSPCCQGTASSFYRPRGGGLQSCRTALSATYGGMAHGVVELIVVLANLAPGGRRGESCTHPGAASRVAVWELLVWSPSVRRLEGSANGIPKDAQQRVWWCLVALGSHSAGDDAAVPGTVAQWRG